MNQNQKIQFYKKCRTMSDKELDEEITFQVKEAKAGYVVRCLIVQEIQRERHQLNHSEVNN